MNQKLITIAVTTAAAVVAFLLSQPDETFSQGVKLALGAASVALTVVARYLPSEGTPVQVEVTNAVATTSVDDTP